MPVVLFAHSGRTDSSGGHKDNKNISGLGSYHYHCGGYPAHLHKNGVCPYEASYDSTSSSTIEKKSTPVYTEIKSEIVIEGTAMQTNTININNTNLVELRTLCEKLGIAVKYDPEMRSIQCTKGSTSFLLQIDSTRFWLNDELRILDVAPIAYNGRTMVPARVVAEAIGKVVTYDSNSNQIVIQ